MYFGNLINELKRIFRGGQEERYESKICSLSLRDLCIIQTAIFTLDQIENLFTEKIGKPYEKFIEKKRREEEFSLMSLENLIDIRNKLDDYIKEYKNNE